MERFHKIVGLPPEKSDNFQRVQWIENKIHMYQTRHSTSRLLDVGAGLGVFPFEMARRGWNTTVLEPALEFCTHLRNIGFHEVLQGFYKPNDVSETFQLITLNKVLEHIADPAVVLDQLKTALAPDGLIYLEVPDGEAALRVGKDREEFFVEHLHVFSRNSLNRLLRDTSFIPIAEETLREPSGKFTLRSISKPQ
jgi:SAM-dependent methyltransferase